MQQDELFFQAFLSSLNGLIANPQNVKSKASDMVEQAINCAAYSKDRLAQIVSAFNAPVIKTLSVSALDAQPSLTYTTDISGQLNKTPDTAVASANPTSVRQPDGTTSIARKGNGGG